ncbi:MAG: DUF4302 domain-containing protein [Muribaculaceae bacterium]|nr:DUF4302 domain-containing protein [Muribaculaceae bacterium]
MKKLFYISTFILSLSLVACAPSEVDDLFDESPAARMDNAVKNYTEMLKADGGRWLMEYFCSAGEPGYNYIMTFHDDGTVDIATKNSYVNGGAFYSDRSLWEVVSDYGPVLSFNTYNSAFHVFSNPEIELGTSGTSTSTYGKGHEGDYEFVIVGSDENHIKMRGKKTAITIMMTRLTTEMAPTDEAYFTNLNSVLNATFNNRINDYILTTASGKRYICNGDGGPINSMFWSFYPEGSSLLDNGEYMNAIFTVKGVRFMEPLSFLNEYDENDVAAQNFEIQPDGTLLCTEDGLTTIKGPAFADLFHQKQIGWTLSKVEGEISGDFLTIYNQIVDEAKNTKVNNKPLKYNFQWLQLGYDNSKAKYRLYFRFHTGNSYGSIYLNHEIVDDHTIKFSFDPNAEVAYDTNGGKLYGWLPSLRAMVDLFCTGEYELSCDNLMVSNPLLLKSKSNPNNFVYIKFETASL